MLLLKGLVCFNLAISAQILVLLFALFFVAYVSKNQLHKWLRYGGIGLAVLMGGIIICSLVSQCCHRSYNSCAASSGCAMKSCSSHGCCMKGGDSHCMKNKKSCHVEKRACHQKVEGPEMKDGAVVEEKIEEIKTESKQE